MCLRLPEKRLCADPCRMHAPLQRTRKTFPYKRSHPDLIHESVVMPRPCIWVCDYLIRETGLIGELYKTYFIYFQPTGHRNPTHIHMFEFIRSWSLGAREEVYSGWCASLWLSMIQCWAMAQWRRGSCQILFGCCQVLTLDASFVLARMCPMLMKLAPCSRTCSCGPAGIPTVRERDRSGWVGLAVPKMPKNVLAI